MAVCRLVYGRAMTDVQRLQIRSSEIRSRLNAIVETSDADLTEDVRSESDRLTTEIRDVEVKLRAAIAAAPDEHVTTFPTETPEARERRELHGRTGVHEFVGAACRGVPVSGAAAELSAAYGAGGHLPLAMLGSVQRRRPEVRAVTPGTTDDASGPIAPYIFEQTVTEFLQPGAIVMVETGPYFSVTVTTPPTAALLDKSADAPATAGAFTTAERRPVRISGKAEFQIEDAAVLASMEASLQASLTDLLGSQVDESVIAGKAATPDYNGLFDVAADVGRPSAAQSYADVMTMFADMADGRFSYGMGDLRACIGSYTYGKLESLYRGANADTSAYDRLASKLAGFRVSDRMPAVTDSDSQKGIVVLGAGEGPPRIEVPVWNRIEMIRDQFTGAGMGVVILTVVALIGAPVVRYGTAVLKETHFRLA